MDHPVREIGGVITALCQGTRSEQTAALNDYFTPDAYFIHPFCRVPSFTGVQLPLFGTQLDSRFFLRFIYQWYRILSPNIEFTIDSTIFDQQAGLLYLTIRQVFTIWFVPFNLWQSHVKLVTVLKLDKLHEDEDGQAILDPTSLPPGDTGLKSRYFIRGQEDLYQVNDFVQFFFPNIGNLVWSLWQLFATLLCMLGVAALWPVTTVHEYLMQKGADWGRIAKKQ